MAPITWRNVEAPDFRGVLLGLNQAQQSFQGALTPIAEALRQREVVDEANWLNARNNNAVDFRAELMNQFRTPEAYQAGLADGSVQALLGRYQNIDRGKALDLIDSRLPTLQQRATQDITYRNTVRDDLLRPNIQMAKAAAARNDPLTYYAATAREGMENYVGDLAPMLEAGRRAFEQDGRLATQEERLAAAELRAQQDQEQQMLAAPLQRQLLEANIRKANAEAAKDEAGGGGAGAGGATLENRLYEREMERAKEQVKNSPIGKGYLGEPDADEYVRGRIDKLFDKDEAGKKAAYSLLKKYGDGVVVKGQDGKETRYKVPAATMAQIIEQNLGKFESGWFSRPDTGAVGTALEERFRDNNFLSSYADGENARTRLTDMENLMRFGTVGGAGAGSGGGGGTLAPINRTNNGTPMVRGTGGRGDPPPGSGLVPVNERMPDTTDGTAADIAELRRELANARSPEIRQVLQGELDRKLSAGVRAAPAGDAASAVARVMEEREARATGSAPAAAPAAPARQAPTLEQASAAARPAPAFQVNQDMEASIRDVQTRAAAGDASVRYTPEQREYLRQRSNADRSAAVQQELARDRQLKGAQIAAPWSITDTNRQPTAAEQAALRADASRALTGSPAPRRPGTGERPSIYAGEAAWAAYRAEQGGNQSAAESQRLASIPNVNTRGQVTGQAPRLPATPLNPTPAKVTASTSFTVGADGTVRDAAPVDIPKGVNFGKPETVVQPKKSAADFMGKANTAVITYVQDGDTARMDNGLTCRIDTIDAQETDKSKFNPKKTGQPYGEQARRELMDLVQDKEVEVRITQPKPDDNGRFYCQISVKGTDVDVAMVQRGAAEIYRGFVVDKRLSATEQTKRLAKAAILGPAEAQARAAGVGQWGLPNYERPQDYRRRTD